MYLVCTRYCFKIILSAANLRVHGMEALLWQIEGIASCTHHTPEQLRLPFHSRMVNKLNPAWLQKVDVQAYITLAIL